MQIVNSGICVKRKKWCYIVRSLFRYNVKRSQLKIRAVKPSLKMTQLWRCSYSFHEHGSGAHGFHESGSGALFLDSGSSFCSFSHVNIFNCLNVRQVE